MRPPPTLTEEAAAGAAAGVAGTVLGFPLDTVKARLQCGRNSGAWQCVREVATREGVRGFYRGVASPLFSMTLLNTLCFQSYSLTRQLVALPPVPPPSDRRGAEGALWRRFAAGALIAPLVTVVSTPFELVKVQLQLDAKPSSGGGARQFTGAWHAARCIAEQRGVRALWLGAPVNLVREALFLGVYFSCYESFKGALFTRVDGISPSAAVPVAGGLSGACAWFVSFPLVRACAPMPRTAASPERSGSSARLTCKRVAAAGARRTA